MHRRTRTRAYARTLCAGHASFVQPYLLSQHGIRPKATPGVPMSRVALQIRGRVRTRILPSRDTSALATPAGGQFLRARARPANGGYMTRDRACPSAGRDLARARARSAPLITCSETSPRAMPCPGPEHVPKTDMTCPRAAHTPPSHDTPPRAALPCLVPTGDPCPGLPCLALASRTKLSNGKADQDSHPTHAGLESLHAWNGRGSRTSRTRVRDGPETRPVCRVWEGEDSHPTCLGLESQLAWREICSTARDPARTREHCAYDPHPVRSPTHYIPARHPA